MTCIVFLFLISLILFNVSFGNLDEEEIKKIAKIIFKTWTTRINFKSDETFGTSLWCHEFQFATQLPRGRCIFNTWTTRIHLEATRSKPMRDQSCEHFKRVPSLPELCALAHILCYVT